MASRNINVLLSLVDRFTEPLKKPIEMTKDMEKQVRKTSNSFSSFGRGLNNKFLSISSSIAKVGVSMAGLASFASLGAITAYADKAIASAEKEIEVQTKLKTILGNVESIKAGGSGAVESASNQLNSYAANLGKVGAVSKGTILNGMQQLATFQLNADQISLLSDGMADLLAQQKGINATGEDAVGIANMIGKAMGGNASALSRVGITMSEAEAETIKNGTAMERAATVAKVLQNNVGGVNKALGETPEGKIVKTNRQYAAMAKDLGMMLLPIKAKFVETFGAILPIVREKMGGIFSQVTTIMDKLATWFQSNGDQLANALGNGLNLAVKAFEILGEAVMFFLNNANVLVPLLAAIVAGFTAFNAITTVVGVFKSFQAATKGAQTTMAALNMVMAANPAVLIALAIAALIALIVVLVMHWDQVKAVATAVWEAIANEVAYVSNAISTFIAGIVAWFSEAWNTIETTVSSVWDSIVSTCYEFVMAVIAYVAYLYEGFLETFSPIVDAVSQIFNGITDFIVGVFTGNWDQAWSGVTEIFKGYFDLVKSIAGGVIDWVTEKLNWIGDKIAAIKETAGNVIAKVTGNNENHNATGTQYWQGGQTYVNENNRGELINLPNGSQIIPHDESMRQLANKQGGVVVNVNIDGNVIGNEQFLDQCGKFVTEKVILAMNNM